jgi:hypothetical protein
MIVVNLHQTSELRLLTGVGAVEPLEPEETGMPTTKTPSKRGFAAMDPAKQREIASKGGKASHGGGRKSASAR